MTLKYRNRGTKIEEEDFCHWTEKDVEFKCFEGLNAKLKKFYSWNKAIIVKIEINGRIFCGCLFQDNNSFAPVKFGPPKRPPLPCIIPSKPKPPKRKKNTKTSSANAYSRENWPRGYIDSHNTVEQRLRLRRDKNQSENLSNAPSRIGKEKSRHLSKKVGVLVYNKRKNKSSRCHQKSKKLAENCSRLRRSDRFYKNSFCELQQKIEANSFETRSNYKSSAIECGHASPKGNKSKVKSVEYKDKKCDALGKTYLPPKPNLRPRRAKNGSELEFIHSDSESNETLSSQYTLIDLTASPTECDEIQHPTDIIDKIDAVNESSVHQISQHPIINPENKEGNKIIFVSDVLSPTLNVGKTLEFANNAKEEGNDLLKSKRKKRKRKAFEKECSDLSDKFEKMTIRADTFGQPMMQSSPKRDLDTQDVREEEHFKLSGTEMQKDPNSATAESKPTNRSKFFFEEWCFIKEDQNASSSAFQTKKLRSGKKYQTT